MPAYVCGERRRAPWPSHESIWSACFSSRYFPCFCPEMAGVTEELYPGLSAVNDINVMITMVHVAAWYLYLGLSKRVRATYSGDERGPQSSGSALSFSVRPRFPGTGSPRKTGLLSQGLVCQSASLLGSGIHGGMQGRSSGKGTDIGLVGLPEVQKLRLMRF